MAQDDPGNDLLIKPGGMVSAIPSHLSGTRGAKPTGTVINLANGFKNLVSLNGETAVPFLQRLDFAQRAGSLLLGGNTKGAGNTVDVADPATQPFLLAQHYFANVDTGVSNPVITVFNTECIQEATTSVRYGAYKEPFTTAGSVTVTAGSPIVVGAGTAWLTDVLAGVYMPAANKALNLVVPGDILSVSDGAGGFVHFRIVTVTDATHLVVFPTPTAGNAAIGAARGYNIYRTGYGGYSRGLAFFNDTTQHFNFYYAGNSHNSVAAGGQLRHGVLQAFQFTAAAAAHFMGPTTTDALGVTTGFYPKADDIAFYKGYLLYGAGSAISWTQAGFPAGDPFTTTDCPAANISVVDATSKFICFEYLGDQLVAMFEEAIWLIVATGTVPEFNFYRMPESLGIIAPGANEPCGIPPATGGLVYGRTSCTGRGAVFYLSNRGVEQLSGGLADEASAPIANSINFVLRDAALPFFFSWSDDFDLLWVGGNGSVGQNAVYNPATKDWSQIVVVPTQGGLSGVRGVMGGVPPQPRATTFPRVWHIAYYEILNNAGTPGINGGLTASVSNTPDRSVLAGVALEPWLWRTPVIPLGLRYPDFSFGGFLADFLNSNELTATTINWTLYGGSSPYQTMNVRDSGIITLPTVLSQGIDPFGGKTPWTSSRVRLAKKVDDPFVFLEFTSLWWAQLAGVILFNANTQVKR